MSVNTNLYMQPLTQDLSRGPSGSIWGPFNRADAADNPADSPGASPLSFWDDFDKNPAYGLYNGERQIGQWAIWIGNNSGAAIGDGADLTNLPEEGAILGLIGGTTGIDITAAAGAGNYRLVSPATGFPMGGRTYFECRVAFSSATSAYGDLFCGLMDRGDAAGTRITSAASLCFSSTNTLKTGTGNGGCLGFWKRATTNPTDWAVAYNVNNGTVQLPDSGVAATAGLQKILTNSGVSAFASGLIPLTSTSNVPIANAFVKLGFIFDPTTSCPTKRAAEATTANQVAGSIYTARVRFFLNGQELPWFLNTADVQAAVFPNTFMCPVIGYRSGGTGDGIGYVDWVKVGAYGTY